MSKINPSQEGITHINAYSKSSLELGRLLSNWAHSPFSHPVDGVFASIEAYWFWLMTQHEDRDSLRSLVGFKALELGKNLRALSPKTLDDLEFRNHIKLAYHLKVESNPRLQKLLTTQYTDLPIIHYYLYGDKVIDAGYAWCWSYWCEIRTKLLEDLNGKG